MIRILALWLGALLSPGGQITWLSVSPVSQSTEVVIRVQGDVTYKEPFMMEDGRLVIDIQGISNATETAQTVNRGGITRFRVGQVQPNVARVVVELSRRLEFSVSREEGLIRIRFPNGAGLFEPYSVAMSGKGADNGTGSGASGVPGTGTPAYTAVEKSEATPPSARSRAQGTAAQSAAQTPTQRPQGDLMTMIIRDRPLSEVLGDFSEFSGRTILPGGKVGATLITAQILPPGLPWPLALESILEANGLNQRVLESGVIIVEDAAAVGERQKNQTLVTVNIPLQYVTADSVATAVATSLTKDIGKVSVVASSNSLLVTDAQSGIDRVMSIIKLVDVKPTTIEINAKIAFIDRTALEALGVVYDLKDSRGTQLSGLADNFVDTNGNGTLEPSEATPDNVVLLGGNSIAALGNANFRVANPALTLATSLVLGRHTLISFLEALQTVSLSDIQASPMVRTQDNYEASIQVGERTSIRVIDAASAGGGEAPRASVRTEQTGIILRVTPHVTGSQIQMRMHAERSNLGAATADLISFQTQQADNVVTVQDGETVAIGGLTVIEKTKSRSGIPLLMDLPLLGKLFRNDRNQETKRDLLILVTPHIVRDQ